MVLSDMVPPTLILIAYFVLMVTLENTVSPQTNGTEKGIQYKIGFAAVQRINPME